MFFPDLPGCTSAGHSMQMATRNAEQALKGHIDLAVEHGEALPEPSELDQITVEPDVAEVGRILVRAEVPLGPVRVSAVLG